MRITIEVWCARAAAVAIARALCGKRSFFAAAAFVYHLAPTLTSRRGAKKRSTPIRCYEAPWIIVGGVGQRVIASHVDWRLPGPPLKYMDPMQTLQLSSITICHTQAIIKVTYREKKAIDIHVRVIAQG